MSDINNSCIKTIGEEHCTGCFGCASSCSFDAIKLEMSEDGFYIPKIDENKCTECGLCKKHCPVINYKSSNFTRENIKTYAAFSNNDEIRFESSSGGIFTEAAESFIKTGGIVSGTEWDAGLGVKHILVEDKTELYKLRGSKYIQSNMNGIYSRIKNLVENEGRRVLFTGTPCQVAALKSLTSSENLCTIDLICHGVPSKMIFNEYLKYISDGKKVEAYNFRDKSLGWSKYMVKMKMENGNSYECITREDPFFHGFICDLYLNKACYNCKFSSLPRSGDLTIGDFWKVPEILMDERGVSVVLANNQKGISLIDRIHKEGRIELIPRSLDEAINGNPRIHDGYLRMRSKREEILEKAREKGFEYIVKNHISKTKRYVYDNE